MLGSDVDILVIDNTAFATGFNINVLASANPGLELYTTPEIYNEASKLNRSRQNLDIASDQGILTIQSAAPSVLEKIEHNSKITGDFKALSKADKTIIALAFEILQKYPEKQIKLISDDYSVQNLCKSLKIPILPLRQKGIKKHIHWETYCPSCYQIYPNEKLGEKCPECSVIIKRKPKKTREL